MYIRNKHIEKGNKNITKCPVCEKAPKIYSNGSFIKIQCKPFLRKPHCFIEEKWLNLAFKSWENEVSNADFQKGRRCDERKN